MSEFPRILFVTPVSFNPLSGGGATFSSLFKGWPKERLATVHNDYAPPSTEVCDRYFFLGSRELDFVPPFNYLRRRRSPAVLETPNQSNNLKQLAKARPRARWLDKAREILLGDSIPERAHLTPELERWIGDFQPGVIYTILGSNGMMSLIEQIRVRFNLPTVVHIMDDWMSAAPRSGVFAPLERRRMLDWVSRSISNATTCCGISTAMCEAFARRYGRSFTPFQYALDRGRWGAIHKRDMTVSDTPEILYIGSIFPNAQLDSLVDCAKAVTILNEEGFRLRLRIVTSAANCARYGELLRLHPNIILQVSATSDDEFFNELADADALLLPVNFDSASIDFIRYSMPTKVPAYLNSGTPILAYGSNETAQIDYAAKGGWALVQAERSLNMLTAQLKHIMSDMALRQRLSAAARDNAGHHDVTVVRSAFQDMLRRSAGGQYAAIT